MCVCGGSPPPLLLSLNNVIYYFGLLLFNGDGVGRRRRRRRRRKTPIGKTMINIMMLSAPTLLFSLHLSMRRAHHLTDCGSSSPVKGAGG
jgi:hypothetical protein